MTHGASHHLFGTFPGKHHQASGSNFSQTPRSRFTSGASVANDNGQTPLDHCRASQKLWVQIQINDWVVVSNILYFQPYLGKIPILTNIFQMGWNHQLDEFWLGDVGSLARTLLLNLGTGPWKSWRFPWFFGALLERMMAHSLGNLTGRFMFFFWGSNQCLLWQCNDWGEEWNTSHIPAQHLLLNLTRSMKG